MVLADDEREVNSSSFKLLEITQVEETEARIWVVWPAGYYWFSTKCGLPHHFVYFLSHNRNHTSDTSNVGHVAVEGPSGAADIDVDMDRRRGKGSDVASSRDED